MANNKKIEAPEADKALGGNTDETVTQRESQVTSTTTATDTQSVLSDDKADFKDQEIQRLKAENETKDRIINIQNDKILQLEKLAGLVSKDGLTVSRDGETYRVVDGITKSIHHNHVAIKVVDFTDDMIKEYVEKGFLEKV